MSLSILNVKSMKKGKKNYNNALFFSDNYYNHPRLVTGIKKKKRKRKLLTLRSK